MKSDYERRLNEAAIQYLSLFEKGEFPNLDDFIAAADADLQHELKPYIESVLAEDAIEDPLNLTEEEEMLLRSIRPWQQAQFATYMQQAFPPTLSEMRQDRGMSLGSVARQVNVPPALLDRLERGAILITTLPKQLITRLAGILERTESEIDQILLATQRAAGQSATQGQSYLSAEDGTHIPEEEPITFEEALRLSGATDDEISAWAQ